jgi:hypothetical protein
MQTKESLRNSRVTNSETRKEATGIEAEGYEGQRHSEHRIPFGRLPAMDRRGRNHSRQALISRTARSKITLSCGLDPARIAVKSASQSGSR